MKRALRFAAVFATGALAAAAGAAPAPTPAPKVPLDFTGTWRIDMPASTNVSANMKDAVLVVEQKGNRVRVSPGPQGAGKINLAADEIVADGQAYEKAVGGGKGVLTARFSADGRALEMRLTGTGGTAEEPLRAVQISRWTLSPDRSTWVRETRTTGSGQVRTSRLIFRREVAGASRTPSSAKAPASAPTAAHTAPAPTPAIPTNPKR